MMTSSRHPAAEYEAEVRPLLLHYCSECHSQDVTEADIDLDSFITFDQVRRRNVVWLRVRWMLDSGRMLPQESSQPTDEVRTRLQTWVREYLKREAEATAGDPGPIALRRLNNEEYRYTVRDFSGVVELDPAREFPVDGAAGEGFINTGSA